MSALPAGLLETGVYGESRYGKAVYAQAITETGIWNASPSGSFRWGGSVPESFVVGESRVGMAAAGATDSPFEAILRVIGNGSFPASGKRETLTRGQRKQLRDAMILEAHSRERRDIFVTNDVRAFVRHGKPEALESPCETRIMTVDEFCTFLDDAQKQVRRFS